jgi:hypothetical protein
MPAKKRSHLSPLRAFRKALLVASWRHTYEKLAAKAEDGYDVEETIRRRGGRPPIGSAAASVESVRLEPELRQALASRAEHDHETTSSVIRRALREYLKVA